MLKDILTISGKPGLFKIVSRGNGMFVAASLVDGKRGPVYRNDRIVSLADISIFTLDEDIPLYTVFDAMYKKENGAKATIDANSKGPEMQNYFSQVMDNLDYERIHTSDFKKMIQWYNLLLENGFTDFGPKEKEATE